MTKLHVRRGDKVLGPFPPRKIKQMIADGKIRQNDLIRAEGGADGGSEDHLSSKTTVQLLPGDVISYRTSGGGGYGDPFARDPIRLLDDVAQLKISVERARDRYGVVVDFAQGPGSGKINEPATQELRRGR